MKRSAIVLAVMLGAAAPAFAQVDLGLSARPGMAPVPEAPGVSYAPDLDANYFYYNDLYWDFDGNDWYSSTGYDGPWDLVPGFDVPYFLWDVPVRYYHHAPDYFRAWRGDEAPHWGEHFGAGWQGHRGDGHEFGGGFGRGAEHGGFEHSGGFGGEGEHGGGFGGGGEHGGGFGGGGEHGGGGGHGR